MISLKMSGMDGIKKAIATKNKALIEGIDMEIKASCMDINAAQVTRAPIDTGKLRQSLGWEKEADLNYSLVSKGMGAEYAPYIEFGTGGMVDIPANLSTEASKFKGKGLRRVNMKAQPFFFAPFFEKKKDLIKNIIRLLGK
jgi:hypothetical protein